MAHRVCLAGVRRAGKSYHGALQADNLFNDVSVPHGVMQQIRAAVELAQSQVQSSCLDLHHRVDGTPIPDQSLPGDLIAIFHQELAQLR